MHKIFHAMKILKNEKEAEVIKLMYELKKRGELKNVEIFERAKRSVIHIVVSEE